MERNLAKKLFLNACIHAWCTSGKLFRATTLNKRSYSLPVAGISVGVQSHEGLLVHDGRESRLAGHVWVSSLPLEDLSSLAGKHTLYASAKHTNT